LADNNRPRANNQDGGNIRPLGHLVSSKHTKKPRMRGPRRVSLAEARNLVVADVMSP
jgi:hypothetical protein